MHGNELVARAAADELRDQVLGYRGFHFNAIGVRRRLLVPDGVVKVMLGFGDPLRVLDSCDPTRSWSGSCLASGIRTTGAIGEHTGLIHGVTILLTPLAAYRLFGVPMSEWAELSVPPEDLCRSPWSDLPDRLAQIPDWDGRFALLDHVLGMAFDTGPAVSPEVTWAWQRIQGSCGRVRIEELAAQTGWHRRHLERRFRCQTGLTPKGATQVMRLQAALRLNEAGANWADASAQAGYYDQPHFDRVFKAMTGRTPSTFRSERGAASRHDAADFVRGQVTSAILANRP
ncbi:AraC family transcriptional regulator [Streptacidiphilus sp. P02-A3a]|uniref:helix-turn-helix domain-containing protein n=1 Tax=Streptacidiphilus sp. P02-A3a TaxID=2704468 RepID=UPI0015F8B186|nr:AraC family transcriptional regulator [Streptacidiphilus sp. P02-A3a]QMU68655.1 helix-turn-helix transcriptional regulator [Streptacidiphilus sp. P02-A3a]